MSVLREIVGTAIFAFPGTIAQRAAQRCLRGPRDVEITLHGHRFDCSTAHKYYWFRENYESDLSVVLERLLSATSIFYDVGAHFGFWELMMARRCARIVALEPSPANFQRLRKNVTDLRNVIALNVAASDKEELLSFTEGSSISHCGTGDLTVPALSLDSVARQYGTPTVVKIDVEGFGNKVLAGMRQILETGPTILAEVHNECEERALSLLPAKPRRLDRRPYPYHVVLELTPLARRVT